MNKYIFTPAKNSDGQTGIQIKISYAETLAASLVLYAQTNKEFAPELKKIIDGMGGQNKTDQAGMEARIFPHALIVLMPSGIDNAVRRAEWLSYMLEANPAQDNKNTASILHAWAEEEAKEEPKQLVVGVVVVAIPGVTMGKLKIKRKMNVIIRNDIARKTGVNTVINVARASNEVIAGALEAAQGNARMLEPEVADWLWGERNIAPYSASGKKLKHIEDEIKELNIPHSVICDRRGSAVIAISPAADTEAQEIYWALNPVE